MVLGLVSQPPYLCSFLGSFLEPSVFYFQPEQHNWFYFFCDFLFFILLFVDFVRTQSSSVSAKSYVHLTYVPDEDSVNQSLELPHTAPLARIPLLWIICHFDSTQVLFCRLCQVDPDSFLSRISLCLILCSYIRGQRNSSYIESITKSLRQSISSVKMSGKIV